MNEHKQYTKPKTIIQKKKQCILSYGYLDNLYFVERKDFELLNLERKTIELVIKNLYKNKEYGGFKYSIDSYLNSLFASTVELDIKEVVDNLYNDGFHVWNRLNKYYVVAFAINYNRFDIYSKDCDKKLIEWEDLDSSGDDTDKSDDSCDSDNKKKKNGKIVYQINDENYNVNPVITFVADILTND